MFDEKQIGEENKHNERNNISPWNNPGAYLFSKKNKGSFLTLYVNGYLTALLQHFGLPRVKLVSFHAFHLETDAAAFVAVLGLLALILAPLTFGLPASHLILLVRFY
jgi:hypothetical protein